MKHSIKFLCAPLSESKQSLYRLNYNGKVSVLAQAEDYALLIKACLDLQQNQAENNDNYWLNKALEIQSEFDQYCLDKNQGGYYNNSSENSDDLLIKEKSYIDNATPSANGIAISNLFRLGLLTDNLDLLEKGKESLNLLSEIMTKSSASCPTIFSALNWYLNGKKVKGKFDLIKELKANYFPTIVYEISEDLPDDKIGMVCKNLTCLPPVETKEKIIELLN